MHVPTIWGATAFGQSGFEWAFHPMDQRLANAYRANGRRACEAGARHL